MMFLNRRQTYIGLLGLMLTGIPCAIARTESGRIQLGNKKTDHVLSSYSIAGGAKGLMTTVLLSKTKYPEEENLRLHLYLDDDWPKVEKAKSCQEKTQYARQTLPFKFEPEDKKQMKQWGYKKPRWRSEIQLMIDPIEEETEEYAPRHHYWYVVLHDCSLDNSPFQVEKPKLDYYVQIYNMLSSNAITHLSTDEFAVSRVHTLTMFISGAICFLLFGKISYMLATSGVVHIAKFLVMAAAGFDAASSAFQLMHMSFYRLDGIGWFLLDSISAYNESICDAFVCFLLVTIAAGWTLPSDVISIQQGQGNLSILQNILVGLANPSGCQSWVNPFSGMFFGLVTIHLFLAHWGLTYNDDYDSYHDLEHLPGKILMGLRSVMGVFMVAGVVQTRIRCSQSLRSFYAAFAVIGTLWFQGLPIITWFCNTAVAFHRRHPSVIIASAFLQSTSLFLLSWIVAVDGSTSYHKVSHMTQKGGSETLTEKIATGGRSEAMTWKLFRNAKVRLD